MAMVGEEQQTDCELRNDQGLRKGECVSHQPSPLPSPPVDDQGEERGEHADRDHEECERVMQR
jgi:hypothetical protein